MMNNAGGWMGGWSGGGMWLWTVIGVAVVALLVVAVTKLSKRLSSGYDPPAKCTVRAMIVKILKEAA